MPEYKLRPYLNYEKNMTNTQEKMWWLQKIMQSIVINMYCCPVLI